MSEPDPTPRFIAPLRVGPGTLATGSATGPLAGVVVAVKDIIDVAGIPTGVGNPDVLATASPAAQHAEVVRRLLGAGAAVIGKAHTDEFAYSLSGTNAHYGTPHNPAAPGRVPGGSSSGSAAAVASGVAASPWAPTPPARSGFRPPTAASTACAPAMAGCR